MKLRNLLLIGSMAVMGAAFTSCSKDNLYDSEFASKKQNAEYEANFVKKYGQDALNQNWDFTTGQTYTSLPSSGSTRSITRGEGDIEKTMGEMIVEKEIIQWVFDNLKAGENNFVKGSPFYMKTTMNSFTIVPIFQGTASYYWQLWMHIDGVADDIQIWGKGEGLSWRAENSTEWTPAKTDNTGVSKNAFEVKGPTITFSNMEADKNMYFYLKVWNSYDDYSVYKKNPRILSSLQEMMIALEGIDKPKNVPAGNTVSVIGCEDNNASNTDNDYEDLVFLMYGNPAPPIMHTDSIIVEKTKRYMMEDLGGTDDFDFNDVVVDVNYDRQLMRNYYKVNKEGGFTFLRQEFIKNLEDEAIVRAAGGMLEFTLKIGDTTWTKGDNMTVTDMWNTGWGGAAISYGDKTYKFKVSGYIPSSNNVSVSVQKEGETESGAVETISFPQRGEAPKIIAVDASNNWMKERQSIPTSWFTE